MGAAYLIPGAQIETNPLLFMNEGKDDVILSLNLYFDVLVDFQGDRLDRGCVHVDAQVPPVPSLRVLIFGEVVAQAVAQAQPRWGGRVRGLWGSA